MPDGQRFLSGDSFGTVLVRLLDGTFKNSFELHTHEVWALVALPDNQHALAEDPLTTLVARELRELAATGYAGRSGARPW